MSTLPLCAIAAARSRYLLVAGLVALITQLAVPAHADEGTPRPDRVTYQDGDDLLAREGRSPGDLAEQLDRLEDLGWKVEEGESVAEGEALPNWFNRLVGLCALHEANIERLEALYEVALFKAELACDVDVDEDAFGAASEGREEGASDACESAVAALEDIADELASAVDDYIADCLL